MRPLATRLIPVLLLLSLTACIDVIPDDGISQQQIPNSSAEATFLVFEFDGVLQTDFIWPGGEETVVEEQLLYTIGQLNGHRSVGRLDALEVEITDTTNFNRSQIELRYHARLPVAWGSRHQDQIHRRQRPVQFGKTQVVADR